MDIVKLLQDLQGAIQALTTQLADAQAAADLIAKENYDKGFADGKAAGGSDKLYSQEELDAAVKAAVDPLQAQVTDLQAQVSALQTSVDQKVSDALVALKADLLVKYQELEVAIQEKELGFEGLLK